MNSSRFWLGSALVVLIAVLGVAFITNHSSHSSAPVADVSTTNVPAATTTTVSTTDTANASSTESGAPASGYTLAEIAKHADATSCWSAINGNVYDLTKWISQHPGGEGAILSICGKDGSAAFNGQHGSQGKPNQTLATFKIGALSS